MHGEMGIVVGGIVTLMLLAAATLVICNRLRFPFSIALLLLGMVLAQLGDHVPQIFGLFDELEISADLILYVFLPTLVFESACHLDWRQLRRDLLPILTLAAPGLLLSSLLIATLLHLIVGMAFTQAWLLGAILSATDPVAVIALFKELGAPSRLTILVEGESLFNDATAIVLSRILIGIAASAHLDSTQLLSGSLDFLLVFFGGILVGWLLGHATARLLGMVQADAEVEITLTTVLAYLSFLLAEEWLHVSGVMATVTAGLVYGHSGWMRVSVSVRAYLENFWKYMAFVATALIFLLVGLSVDVGSIFQQWQTLSWLIIGMLLSRALVIYALLPIANRMPGAQPVSLAYRHVMYWGGLRGAIALAIVLSLPSGLDFKQDFISLVAGALLFTLLVQGLSMNLLVRRLQLNKQALLDRYGHADALRAMAFHVLGRLPELNAGGMFSAALMRKLQLRFQNEADAAEAELEKLQSEEFGDHTHEALLAQRVLAEERRQFDLLFDRGHLPERVMRLLIGNNAEYQELARKQQNLPAQRLPLEANQSWLTPLLLRFPRLHEHIRRLHLAGEYQAAWGLYQSCRAMLQEWKNLFPNTSDRSDTRIRALLEDWQSQARLTLDQTAEQFPEFAAAMQNRHAERLATLGELEVIDEREEHGSLCSSTAMQLRLQRLHTIADLRGLDVSQLKLDPATLLTQIELFRDASPRAIQALAESVISHTVEAGNYIIRQHEPGDSLFLIARGVVRVCVQQRGENQAIASLMAGDVFGEMGLLHQTPRSASVISISPCHVYELKRSAWLKTVEILPELAEAAARFDSQRRAELDNLSAQATTQDSWGQLPGS